MTILNWENLKRMLCPYCEEPLTEEDEIKCTECFFHIEKRKFKDIASRNMFKWQNIHQDKCPVDGYDLVRAEGTYETLRCSNIVNCSFRIREDRLKQILEDPTHAANRFNKPKMENLYGRN